MNQPSARAYIGIGSNLNDPVTQVETALNALSQLSESCLRRHSSLYRSAPMGPADQPDYINAVAELETSLEPVGLLNKLQEIETQQGRTRAERWGPRTLDLDLLLYGRMVLDDPGLVLPHPGIADRPFVLYPLSELVSDIEIPGQGMLGTLLADCPSSGLSKLDQPDKLVKGM